MLVKIAPMGQRVVEVNVEPGTSIDRCLEIADIDDNGQAILLNGSQAFLDTQVQTEGSTIVLAPKMKGGRA